jgi:hypothetical protein
MRVLGVPKKILWYLYTALFEPLIAYGLVFFGSSAKKITKTVRVLQNDAIRAVLGKRRSESVSADISKQGILPADKLCFYRQSVLMYKMRNNMLPKDITFEFECSSSRLRRSSDLRPPNFRLESSRMSLAYTLPKIWNSLSNTLRDAPNLGQFKKLLMEHLRSG